MDQITQALTAIRVLRSSVTTVFDTLSNGVVKSESGELEKDNKFLTELTDLLNSANNNLREVETTVGCLQPPAAPFTLGNTAFLSYETSLERQSLYSQLVNSYKWHDRIREYSTFACALLTQNSLKRSYYPNSNKRRKPTSSSHNVSPQKVDELINCLNFNNMSLKIYRPFSTNAIVHINLGRVLKAAIVLKGFMIEWVTVKGFEESLENVDEHWTESRHQVFRKVQDHAHAAMLHFFSPTLPELAIKSFITWFRSYVTLFADQCKKCGNRLHNTLPPTWRDLRTLEPFHEECKH